MPEKEIVTSQLRHVPLLLFRCLLLTGVGVTEVPQ